MNRVWWYALLVLLAGSSFGLVSTIMKVGYDLGFTVQQTTDAQYVVGVVLLWVIALFHGGKHRISKKQWGVLAVIGLSGAGTSYTYYLALTNLPASLAIVLLFQFAWMVVVIDILVTRQLPSLQKWLGLVFIVIGTVLAVGLLEHSIGRFPMWAFLLGLVAGFCYAITLYMSAYVDTETSPATRSALTATIAMVAIFCVFPPTSLLHVNAWWNMSLWALFAGLFAQVVPLSFMLIAIPHTGGRMAGVLGSIELPVAVFVAWAALGESVSPLRWLGVAMILAGIVVSEIVWNGKLLKFQRKTV